MTCPSSNHKRLLFVNGHLNIGGVEKSLFDLLNNINKDDYDIDLLLLEENGKNIYTEFLPNNVNVIVYDSTQAFGPIWSTLGRNLFNCKFSFLWFRILIILSSYFGSKSYHLIKYLLGIKKRYDVAIAYRVGFPNEIVSNAVDSDKKICWWHHGECNYPPSQIDCIRKLWKKMDVIVAVSHGCRKMIIDTFHQNPEKVHVVPNIIDIQSINDLAGGTDPFKDHKCINIITVGRLSKEKKIEDVPRIAQKLLDKGVKSFKWYIIGDGDKREIINTLIIEKKTEEHVYLLGAKDNPYPYIKYADIMVHTSYVEAHCLTILEAMALKTPCVVTRTNIPQDFTIDGENCYIAEQDIDNQVSCVEKMIHNLDKSQTMTEQAYQMVKRRYSANAIISQIETLLK